MSLARSESLAVLSADSRQIYRGFDIGTAKPGNAERASVPHYGIDIIDPGERYSAAAWAASALGWMTAARESGAEPAVVGGTGFYLRALTAPLFQESALEAERRSSLQPRLAALSSAELRRWCEALDPDRARLGRAQLLRAVEIALLTGVPMSEWRRRSARPPRVRPRYLVLDPGAVLGEWIAARAAAMFDAGWGEEIERLRTEVAPEAPAWKATGYRAVRDWVEGKSTRKAALERVVIDTRQYAKRQRTWFRHQLRGADVTIVNSSAPDAIERASGWWHAPDET
jgi:tRNA dimethylallyltransferase